MTAAPALRHTMCCLYTSSQLPHFPAPSFLCFSAAGILAWSEEDLADALKIPNAVVGLKSHIVPTGAVKSDKSLFPYVQYETTIGERYETAVGEQYETTVGQQYETTIGEGAPRGVRCWPQCAAPSAKRGLAGGGVGGAGCSAGCHLRSAGRAGLRMHSGRCRLAHRQHKRSLAPPDTPPLPCPPLAVGMCNATEARQAGQNWGTRCTIDAKRLWKIFYITPSDPNTGGPRMKARGDAGWARGRAVGCAVRRSCS